MTNGVGFGDDSAPAYLCGTSGTPDRRQRSALLGQPDWGGTPSQAERAASVPELP
jgi:hypothetical protein